MVEAVPEREALKADVFRALDGLAPPHAVLASNTSSISITRLAAATHRPDRVVGLHFMNPVRRACLCVCVCGGGEERGHWPILAARGRDNGACCRMPARSSADLMACSHLADPALALCCWQGAAGGLAAGMQGV